MKKRRLNQKRKWNSQVHIGRGFLRIALFVLCALTVVSLFREMCLGMQEEKSDRSLLQDFLEQNMMKTWLPGMAVFCEEEPQETTESTLAEYLLLEPFPVMRYGIEQPQEEGTQAAESSYEALQSYEELQLLEGKDEEKKAISQEELEYDADAIHLDKSLEEAFLAENKSGIENMEDKSEYGQTETEQSEQDINGENEQPEEQIEEQTEQDTSAFHEVEEPVYRYQWQELAGYQELVKAFYAIDSTTAAGEALLNTEKLLQKDMRMQGSKETPQILIYHTHSQETFADSIPGDEATSIVGAGEKLAQLLREKYGYNVIHHTESFDKEARDYAYSNALPAIEEVLAQNPSIEVVIDLHRDEMPTERRLVVDLQGKPTAQFMFFNGLSRTKNGETIAYLENPNLEDNLAFSFQMQAAANEYYPGVARRIYLKAYRYNMHLRGKSLLIELGAQNNTVEEAMNAIEPLAHILHLVLSGNEPDKDA